MNRDARIRSVLFNLHLIGGLVAGLFLLILGASGTVLAFSDEIDSFLQPSIFKVTPQAQRLPVTQLAAHAAAVLHPEDIIAVYVPSVRLDRSYWFTVIPSHHRLLRQVFGSESNLLLVFGAFHSIFTTLLGSFPHFSCSVLPPQVRTWCLIDGPCP